MMSRHSPGTWLNASPVGRRLLAAFKKLTAEYGGERDSFYDGVTNIDGEYEDRDAERIVAEMDALIDECRAVIAEAEKEA